MESWIMSDGAMMVLFVTLTTFGICAVALIAAEGFSGVIEDFFMRFL
jgi:hypothetical protein